MAKCLSCRAENIENAKFCGSCGQPITKLVIDPSDPNAHYKRYVEAAKNQQRQGISPNKNLSNFYPKGLFTTLLGEAEYSTARAKWFYSKSELILNITFKLVIAWALVMLVFTFLINPFAGIYQLLIDVVVAILLVISIVGAKILLMGVGAVIRIAELLETRESV